MAVIYIFGNGNTSFDDFNRYYVTTLKDMLDDPENSFAVCDFRGVDTLAMEFLKDKSSKVTIFHVGERARYLPDAFRTSVSQWKVVGGFTSDSLRDQTAIDQCSHFLAVDFNSDDKRKSGTQRNIEQCLNLGKVRLGHRE